MRVYRRDVSLRLYELRFLAAEFLRTRELSRVPGFPAYSGATRLRILERGGSGPGDRYELA